MTDYPKLVSALTKPGQDIIATLTPKDAQALHMAVGVACEAGELLNVVRQAAFDRKPIDRKNVIEELGDLEFYMEGLRQGLGITREQTIAYNISEMSASLHRQLQTRRQGVIKAHSKYSYYTDEELLRLFNDKCDGNPEIDELCKRLEKHLKGKRK